MINLDTGVLPRHTTPALGANTGYIGVGTVSEHDDTAPSEVVVFPSEHRRLLLVEPNTMVVVTGYNLYDSASVAFRKVLRSNGIPAQGTAGCCPSITVANSIRLHSVELPCWKLNKCNPVFVIKTPGSYELDIVGKSADVVVTAMAYPMQPVNEFGNCNCEYRIDG